MVSVFQFSPNCNFFRFGTKLKLSVMQYQIGTHDRDLNDDVSRSICMRYKPGIGKGEMPDPSISGRRHGIF
ncbi:hypothetical protein DK867_06400 [Ochrobactrum sp. POC9]|nr:hypothetical protein DK867_06400 [Ochrobactrum sp. POC9]